MLWKDRKRPASEIKPRGRSEVSLHESFCKKLISEQMFKITPTHPMKLTSNGEQTLEVKVL